jgi:hypothetical protein
MPQKSLPQFVEPMMASSVKEPFDSPDWIFETKLDGYRAIAVIDPAGKARLWSRNLLPLESKFPMVGEALKQLKLRSTVLDGEIVGLAMGVAAPNPFLLRFLKTCAARTLLLAIVTFATLLFSGCANGDFIYTSGRQQGTFGLGGVPPNSAFCRLDKTRERSIGSHVLAAQRYRGTLMRQATAPEKNRRPDTRRRSHA